VAPNDRLKGTSKKFESRKSRGGAPASEGRKRKKRRFIVCNESAGVTKGCGVKRKGAVR